MRSEKRIFGVGSIIFSLTNTVSCRPSTESETKNPRPSGPGVEAKRAGVGFGPMMFGGLAFMVAAADRQGTESVAAAAAMMIYVIIAVGLIVMAVVRTQPLISKQFAPLSTF